MILHDWSDEYSIKILRHLRDAAGPETQLVVVDNIMSYACPASAPANRSDIPGTTSPALPPPLLSNCGLTGSLAYLTDIQVGSSNFFWGKTIC